MRIIWVEHQRWTLLFFCLAEISLCVSVSSTTAQEELLNGAVGESVTFPTRVPVSGFIMYEGNSIGQVFNKVTDTESDEKFKNRLHWNSQSGVFTLSDLRTADSGLYTVHSTKEEKSKQDYQLMVYDKVSAPQLIKLNTSPPESELCSVLCSVRNVRGLNLSWFKGGDLLNHTSSSSINDTLSLPLDIQQPDNDSYSCVASNPVSKQTTTVSITQQCPHTAGPKGQQYSKIPAIVIPVFLLLLVIVMIIYLWRRKHRKELSRHTEDTSATEGLQAEVQYSEINHKNHAQGNICEHASEETHQLTTIYDRIRPLDPVTSSQSGPA